MAELKADYDQKLAEKAARDEARAFQTALNELYNQINALWRD